MKNRINDDVLSLIYGGTDVYPLPDWDDLSAEEGSCGHGKTQPGDNADIFNRDRR